MTLTSLQQAKKPLCQPFEKNEKDYFKQLNNKVVSDNKEFRQTISLLFSENAFCKETIILKDNNRTITNNHELAEAFNTFFSNIPQDRQQFSKNYRKIQYF